MGRVRGVLALGGRGWVVANDAEVRLLEALSGERGARDRLWALAAALDAGVVEAAALRRLNGRLSAILAVERPEELWRVWVPGDLRAAVAYVCVCVNEEMLSRWLGSALAARLDSNLVRGLLPGPGWVSWHVPHRRRWETFARDVHWISELPGSFWERLSSHRDEWLRDVASASDPNARPRVLENLSRSRTHVGEVMDLVGCNPRTPTRVLRRLMQRWSSVQHAALRVGQNRNATGRLLGEMARDRNWELRYVAAWHPRVPVGALRRLARDEVPEVRAAVARAEAAPAAVLEALASDDDVRVRRNVASNRSTAQPVLDVLLGDRRAAVRAEAVANETTPPEMAAARMRDRTGTVRSELAARQVGAEVLAVLAEDPHWTVRQRVAWNDHTAPEVLTTLAGDCDGDVRAAAASNPNTPPDTLRMQAGDDYSWVRSCVAANKCCPREVRVMLAGDSDPEVRCHAAECAALPQAQLEALAADEAWEVRAGAALSSRSPGRLLAALAADPHSHVRSCVCDNDNTPQHLVDALKSDPDYWVRAAATRERQGAQTTPDTASRAER